jgi:hypothetical protein
VSPGIPKFDDFTPRAPAGAIPNFDDFTPKGQGDAPSRTWLDSASDIAHGMYEGSGAKAVVDIMRGAGIRSNTPADQATARKSIDTAKALVHGLINEPGRVWSELGETGNAMLRGDVPGASYHLAGSVPIVGAGAQQVGQDVDKGQYALGFGHALGLLAPFLAPEAAAKVAAVPPQLEAGASAFGRVMDNAPPSPLGKTIAGTAGYVAGHKATGSFIGAAGGAAIGRMVGDKVAALPEATAAGIRGTFTPIPEPVVRPAPYWQYADAPPTAADAPPAADAQPYQAVRNLSPQPPAAAPRPAPAWQTPVPEPPPEAPPAADVQPYKAVRNIRPAPAPAGPGPITALDVMKASKTRITAQQAQATADALNETIQHAPQAPAPPAVEPPAVNGTAAAAPPMPLDQAEADMAATPPAAETPRSQYTASGERKSSAARGQEIKAANIDAKGQRFATVLDQLSPTGTEIPWEKVKSMSPDEWAFYTKKVGAAEVPPNESIPAIAEYLKKLQAPKRAKALADMMAEPK